MLVFLRQAVTATCLYLSGIWLFKIRELKKFPSSVSHDFKGVSEVTSLAALRSLGTDKNHHLPREEPQHEAFSAQTCQFKMDAFHVWFLNVCLLHQRHLPESSSGLRPCFTRRNWQNQQIFQVETWPAPASWLWLKGRVGYGPNAELVLCFGG